MAVRGVYCTGMVGSEEDKVRIIRLLGTSNNHIINIDNKQDKLGQRQSQTPISSAFGSVLYQKTQHDLRRLDLS